MPDYVMLMKGTAESGDWDTYIEKLVESGLFRGGSSLGKGIAVSKRVADGACETTGYMRFSADSIEDVKELLEGNPVYQAGGCIEILEEVPD